MNEALRLDKWLWHARFTKTRSLATRLIEERAVLLDGKPVKPAHVARVGDRVLLRFGGSDHIVEIKALGERRGPAAEARLLYEEIAVAPVVTRWESLIED